MKNILQIVDGFCVIYKVISLADKYNLQGEDRKRYIVRSLAWVQAGGMFTDCKPTVVWALDSDRTVTPYWRTKVFEAYKSKRKERSQEARKIAAYIEKALPTLIVPGYEADDIGGALVAMVSEGSFADYGFTETVLTTVDSDWLGLVRDGVAWCNVNSHAPRVRRKVEAYAWLAKKHEKQSKRKQRLWDMPAFYGFDCRCIWDWKAATGDSADSLPEGSDIALIDLFEPPEEYRLIDSVGFIDSAFHALDVAIKKKVEFKTYEIERNLLDIGVSLPVDPLPLSQPFVIAA